MKAGEGYGYHENYHYLGISQSAAPERAEEFSGWGLTEIFLWVDLQDGCNEVVLQLRLDLEVGGCGVQRGRACTETGATVCPPSPPKPPPPTTASTPGSLWEKKMRKVLTCPWFFYQTHINNNNISSSHYRLVTVFFVRQKIEKSWERKIISTRP